jgi:HEPN domain-containing protein
MIRRDALDRLEEAKEELKTSEVLYKLNRNAYAYFHADKQQKKAFNAIIIYKKNDSLIT